MTKGFLHFIRTKPIYVYLLAIFFVLHGFVENFDFVPVADALLLMVTYIMASLVLVVLSWLLYQNFIKASLLGFLIIGFHFFFGSLQDSLKKNFPGSFVSKYSFILPAAAVAFILIIILLKKIKNASLTKVTTYLNFLLLVVLLIDTALLLSKLMSKQQPVVTLTDRFTICDSCPKLDVYLILADEYAGNDELKNVFHFDNSAFQEQLRSRGFHIIDDNYSNYNYTPFSMASILNLDYLSGKNVTRTGSNIAYCYQQIRTSSLIRFFQANGYKFYNYSVFDFEHQPAPVRETFLPVKTRLITSQTFLSRLQRDLWFHTITFLKSKKSIEDLTYYNQRNNQIIYDLTWRIAQQKDAGPKFVYTHLMMPHYPYYYDKNGKELPFGRLVEGNQVHKSDYVGYLQYSNKKFLELIDQIQRSSATPPIIVLMGDHGFRHFTEAVDKKYFFMNLAAVYFPDRAYSALNDSPSSVNLFRKILNSQFGQHLPLLKDSTIYLHD